MKVGGHPHYVLNILAAYTIDDIDLLFSHIIPLDIWYVLPVESFAPCKSFYPQGGNRRFEQYREDWHLLRPKAKAAAQAAGL
jgi:hypothetical protein